MRNKSLRPSTRVLRVTPSRRVEVKGRAACWGWAGDGTGVREGLKHREREREGGSTSAQKMQMVGDMRSVTLILFVIPTCPVVTSAYQPPLHLPLSPLSPVRLFYFRRRQAPQLELGMAAAYGHEDDRAKFSQAEVDAKIKER